MTGLYFYKLVSPYADDVTKDCKLTVNEIDHNFVTLKGEDIETATFDSEKSRITLTRKNGETMTMDLSSMTEGMTTNFDVTYNSIDGVIILAYNGGQVVIDGLITKDNLSKEILTKVCSDSTLNGLGTIGCPLRLAETEQTGMFKAAHKLINCINGESLPPINNLVKGDRFVTLELFSDYGYLYNYDAVKRINEDLEDCGWRVPTKEDWDNMLNAIEPCEYRNHNSLLNNNMLGRLAGKLLKSEDKWISGESDKFCCSCGTNHNHACNEDCGCVKNNYADENTLLDLEGEFDVAMDVNKKRPQPKPLQTNGVDSFGMTLVPAGYAFDCNPVHYNHFGVQGAYWTSTMMYETDVYSKVFDDKASGVIQIGEKPSTYLSIRLVKDYDGKNHNDIECIKGMNYKTVLMPSLNTEHQHTIWTTTNVAFKDGRYPRVTPNNGIGVTFTEKYIINEWNGFAWERKEMTEGDSIVLFKGLNGRNSEEHRIINGIMVSVTDVVIKTVLDIINKDIEDIKARVIAVEEGVNKHSVQIEELQEKISDLRGDLDVEIIRATNEEKRIEGRLDAEIERAFSEEEKIREKLEEEVNRSISKDEEHDEKIVALREKAEAIEAKLDNEIERSSTKDEEHDNEIINLHSKDEELKQNLNQETEDRKKADEEIIQKLINLDGTVHTYECAKGVLTLHTNDGTPIAIKLESNYGTF